jgi:hypothetical protein
MVACAKYRNLDIIERVHDLARSGRVSIIVIDHDYAHLSEQLDESARAG